jgi:ferrous iron transport protein B
MKILLMGNPNVGKSVIFSRLTGVQVISANYPGTTVGYTRGTMKLGDAEVEVIDVPGTYSLEPTSEAEEIARKMLQTGDVIINIVDATNLERNLNLTLQLLEQDKPVLIALNMWDDVTHKGIQIDLKKLEKLLGVPIVPTVATSGQGIKELVESIPLARAVKLPPKTRAERWTDIGAIVNQVQKVTHRHHTLLERLEDASVKPLSGVIIASIVLLGAFALVRLIGEGLITYVFDPFFNNLWAPVIHWLRNALGGKGILHMILVGQVNSGVIDFETSMGLLTTALYIEFAIVLPYILAFYLMLGVLEDTGYLPRLAILLDTFMHRVGLHGYAIIPSLLGLGCNVPAVLATRILESKRERFIAATLISIAVPCAALQAMIIGLVGERGAQYVALVYGTLFTVWIVIGFILNRLLKGASPELLIEIPPYRLPQWRATFQKLWMRALGFLKEALPVVMAAILVVNVLFSLGVFTHIANFAAPVITGLMGLPKEAVIAIVLGFLRKDVAMGMLAPLALNSAQLVIASVLLAMTFPCIATFVVLTRELGMANMLKATVIMIASALFMGGVLNLILQAA